MEPAPGRRLFRPALTLGMALPALAVVALWGDPRWARSYAIFVAVTAAVLVLAALTRSARRP
jgi:hypothetical protein